MKHPRLCLAAIFLVAVAASAQDRSPAQPEAAASDYARRGASSPAELHAALRVRPEQEAAWRALQSGTAPDPARTAQARGAMERIAAMTTPERLDFTQAQMRRDAADFATRAEVIRGFYAQLDPDQRRVFDQMTGPAPLR